MDLIKEFMSFYSNVWSDDWTINAGFLNFFY